MCIRDRIKPAVAIKQRLRVVELDQADPAGQIVRQHRHFFAAAAQLVQLGFKFRLAFFYGLEDVYKRQVLPQAGLHA